MFVGMYFLLKTYKQTNKTEKAKCLYPNAEMGHSSETQAVGLTVTESVISASSFRLIESLMGMKCQIICFRSPQ